MESLWNWTLDKKDDGRFADCSTFALESMGSFCGNSLSACETSTYQNIFPSTFFSVSPPVLLTPLWDRNPVISFLNLTWGTFVFAKLDAWIIYSFWKWRTNPQWSDWFLPDLMIFSASVDMVMWFLSFILLLWYSIYIFSFLLKDNCFTIHNWVLFLLWNQGCWEKYQ